MITFSKLLPHDTLVARQVLLASQNTSQAGDVSVKNPDRDTKRCKSKQSQEAAWVSSPTLLGPDRLKLFKS